MAIIFHRLAAIEFRSVRSWYRKRNPEVSQRFVEAVGAAMARIHSDPTASSLETR